MGKERFNLRWFEASVVLAGLAAIAVVGQFRDAFAAAPGVMLLATLALFLTPGVLMARWFFGEYFSGVALAPVGFVTSVGLFALSGLPMLVAQSTLDVYLWVCGLMVGASLLAAAIVAFRPADSGGVGLRAPG